MRMIAEQIYNKLLNDFKIKEAKGQIHFFLGDVDIIVHQKDVVGNIIQEWVENWMKKNDIDYSLNPNTQMPPDFFLNPDDKTTDLLEVKAFNDNRNPGFDIADFTGFFEELLEKPWMVHAKYLIFAYDMKSDGSITIKELYLKNLWEICCSSQNWALKVQYKNGEVHKIRPSAWYSNRCWFKSFDCLEDFISAFEETAYKNINTKKQSGVWEEKFNNAYEKKYGKRLKIEKWSEIRTKYIKRKGEFKG